MKKLSLTPAAYSKPQSRLKLKKRKNHRSSLSYSLTQLKQPSHRRSILTRLNPLLAPVKDQLTSINPKTFSLSLLAYFILFVFMDQVSPDQVANIPLYHLYLPFQLILFVANFLFFSSLFDPDTSLIIALTILLLLFFKFQGFVLNWLLIMSLILLGTLFLGIVHVWRHFKLERKLKITTHRSLPQLQLFRKRRKKKQKRKRRKLL